jgi:hypothetical protein
VTAIEPLLTTLLDTAKVAVEGAATVKEAFLLAFAATWLVAVVSPIM